MVATISIDLRSFASTGLASDFSSGASMAASPIYQRGGLVQFGFTNSHPDFTKGGGLIAPAPYNTASFVMPPWIKG